MLHPPGSGIYATNFNPRFTGVSATAANVIRFHQRSLDIALVGRALPGVAPPISKLAALKLSRTPPAGRAVSIWHVRRNSEMQLALFARDILRLPIRIVFTSAAQRLHSAWPRALIARMDAVIATTELAASFVPNVVAVVPHGVDTDLFVPSADYQADWRALGYGGDYGIAAVGRIRPEKGTDLFVEAMIDALPNLPGAVAVVAGRAASSHSRFLDDLKARVAAEGLEDRILFVGEVATDKMPALVRGMKLLVALPRYEGYGMTPLEAMAGGVPVVASDTGYFAKFVGGDAAGRIVGIGDAKAASKAVQDILLTPERYRDLSANALQRARDRFGIEREADAIKRVYDQMFAAAG